MNDHLSADSQALLLLCAHLEPRRRQAMGQQVAPLSPQEWRRLATRLQEAGTEQPGELLQESDDGLWARVGFSEEDTARARQLLERGGQLCLELERLATHGIRVVTLYDSDYPQRLKRMLPSHAPPFLYAVGDLRLAAGRALAIVGSRGVDEVGAEFARAVARCCARSGLCVVSGGAEGVDQICMQAAQDAGGAAIGVVANSLSRLIRAPEVRHYLADDTLLLVSPYHPDAGFSAGNAMGRNKFIYGLADYGLVVASGEGSGGTWAGAQEVLRQRWVPLFVRRSPDAPPGNEALIRAGAHPFPSLDELEGEDLGAWLDRHAIRPGEPEPAVTDPQLTLF